MSTPRNDAETTGLTAEAPNPQADYQRADSQQADYQRADSQQTDYQRADYQRADQQPGQQSADQPRFEQPGDPLATPTQPMPRDEVTTPTPQQEPPIADQTMGPPLGVDEPPMPRTPARDDDRATELSETPRPAASAAANHHAPTDETAEPDSLFAVNDLSGLRSRWDDVQAGFVDDPRMCVQKADGLVSDVVDQLTDGFSQARARLEEQWARGEEVSTEDLRLALTRYREFFQRLLAV